MNPRLDPEAAKWLASTVAFALLLTGCASLGVPEPPAPPTAEAIRARIEASYKLVNGSSATVGTVSATEIASAGYMLVDNECNLFFSAVQKWSNSTGFARKEIALSGAAAAGVLAAIGASATSIALTAIGFGLAAESLDNFQNFALFTPRPESVYKLVTDAMAAYRQSAPPNNPATFASPIDAQDFVAGYATLCTYARIQQFIDQAVQKAVPVDKNAPMASVFLKEDQLILAAINAQLGLPVSPLLTDDAYAKLAWYLDTGFKTDPPRALLQKQFPNIDKLKLDANGALSSDAQAAARMIAQIRQRNSAFSNAVDVLEKANKPQPGGFATPDRIIVPPGVAQSRSIPVIGIQ